MNLKANIIISKLMELGTMVTINDTIDAETAEIVCSEFNCKVNVVSLYDQTVIEEEEKIVVTGPVSVSGASFTVVSREKINAAGTVIRASKPCLTLLNSQVFFWEHNRIMGRPQKLSI